ncbi:MAG TPA: type II secretion system F family protein [Candidatus Limnocylindrales bacterium]|nr:type II secretion system F family protein [Candidatus Limnocylindrales bacterium]
MNYDEFAFFNQQLASMLREGIPLEGALKQLSAGMRTGPLRAEIERLEHDLEQGTPLNEAMARRQLPELYRRLVTIGAQTNDLPGVLTMLADHYHQANALWTRLKGLMVYPLIVLVLALGFTVFISLVFSHFLAGFFEQYRFPAVIFGGLWLPPILFAILALVAFWAVSLRRVRSRLRWRLPAFREASLAQLASAIALMLRKGTPLAEALALAESMEQPSPAAEALGRWRAAIEAGQGKPSQWAGNNYPFPPLFLWLIQKGGEDVTAGFEQAADMFRRRASYRIEMALYGALPISVLFLGQMILWQVIPLLHAMTLLMNALGDMGGS